MDVIRRFADRNCSRHLEDLAVTIDSMLSQPGTRRAVKALFGLSALEHDYDFVTTIEVSIWHGSIWESAADAGRQMVFESWQAKNWDPKVGSKEFDDFCKRINRPTQSLEDAAKTMGVGFDEVMALVSVPGFDKTLLNYAIYVREVSRPEVRLFPVLTT